MAEYGMRQSKQLCRVMADYSERSVGNTQQFVDNRECVTSQTLMMNGIQKSRELLVNPSNRAGCNLSDTRRYAIQPKSFVVQREFGDSEPINEKFMLATVSDVVKRMCVSKRGLEDLISNNNDIQKIGGVRKYFEELGRLFVEANLQTLITEYGLGNSNKFKTQRMLAEFIVRHEIMSSILDEYDKKLPQLGGEQRPGSIEVFIQQMLYNHITELGNEEAVMKDGLKARSDPSKTEGLGGDAAATGRNMYAKWSVGYTFVTRNAQDISDYGKRYEQGEKSAIVLHILVPEEAGKFHDPDSRGYKCRGNIPYVGNGETLNQPAINMLAGKYHYVNDAILAGYRKLTGGKKDIRLCETDQRIEDETAAVPDTVNSAWNADICLKYIQEFETDLRKVTKDWDSVKKDEFTEKTKIAYLGKKLGEMSNSLKENLPKLKDAQESRIRSIQKTLSDLLEEVSSHLDSRGDRSTNISRPVTLTVIIVLLVLIFSLISSINKKS